MSRRSHLSVDQLTFCLLFFRTTLLLEEKEERNASLRSEIQQIKSDVAGWSHLTVPLALYYTHTWRNLFTAGNAAYKTALLCLESGLHDDLRAEQEKLKEKDQERRDLEETVDVLRKELNKTEQARKDASIKVKNYLKTDEFVLRSETELTYSCV